MSLAATGPLWYVLTGTRSGPARARILLALDGRPRSARRLAADLDLDVATVSHHLDVLVENGVVHERVDRDETVYVPSPWARRHWATVEDDVEQA